MQQYTVRRTAVVPALEGVWDQGAFAAAEVAEVDRFHPQSSTHRPRTRAKLVYDQWGFYVLFRVEDRYVRCVNTQYGQLVCKDSCVELFVRPPGMQGYFNFEFNCGGNVLTLYIEDPTRDGPFFRKYTRIPWERAREIRVAHSLADRVEPEVEAPVTWWLEAHVPFALMEHYAKPIRRDAGAEWRGNFYKCGDETSHPHWASWAPIGEQLNFHQPDKFGVLALG